MSAISDQERRLTFQEALQQAAKTEEHITCAVIIPAPLTAVACERAILEPDQKNSNTPIKQSET